MGENAVCRTKHLGGLLESSLPGPDSGLARIGRTYVHTYNQPSRYSPGCCNQMVALTDICPEHSAPGQLCAKYSAVPRRGTCTGWHELHVCRCTYVSCKYIPQP